MSEAKHSITLKIAGKDFSLVTTPESEHYMRLAAEDINNMLSLYDKKYTNATTVDKLVFVALHKTINMLVAQKSLENSNRETERLEKELRNYLDRIETKR